MVKDHKIDGHFHKSIKIKQDGDWFLTKKSSIEFDKAKAKAGIYIDEAAARPYLEVKGDISLSGGSHMGISVMAENSWIQVMKSSAIRADTGIAFDSALLKAAIHNRGHITGSAVGIQLDAQDSKFINYKGAVVKGPIAISDMADGIGPGDGKDNPIVLEITNKGKITGDIVVKAAEVELVNTGRITGNLLLGDGNDIVDLRKGTFAGEISGGKGNDLYYLKDPATVVHENAGEGKDTIVIAATYALGENIENLYLHGKGDFDATGNASNNELAGNSGSNHLFGMDGDDFLSGGGQEADTLTGGAGSDIFYFDIEDGNDIITDFEDGVDHIKIVASTFANFTEVMAAATDVGGNVEINLGVTGIITIQGMSVAQLDASDFIF